jgi:predicted glycosyltransferase
LGVPSVFISKTSRGYIDDQERRSGLVRHVKPAGLATTIQSIKELSRTTREWRDAQRYKLLHDNIDVTAWMVEFVSQFE